MAVIALDQKPGVSYPPGCFVWSPNADSLGIASLLVYSNPTAGSGNCRSGAVCICAATSCQSTFRSKASLSVDRPGLYDAIVEYEKGKQCVYQLGQITCDQGKNYEAAVVDGKQLCQKRQEDICSKTMFGLSDGVSADHKIEVGTRLNVTSTDPQASDYNLSLVAKTPPTPLRRSTTLEFPQTGAWDVYIKRGLETCVALSDMEVIKRQCSSAKSQVMTEGGACATPQIVAAVQVDLLLVTLKKRNNHLIGDFIIANHTVDVGPSAKYKLDWEHHLTVAGDWIQTGARRSVDDYNWKMPLYFHAPSAIDGTVVNATLTFRGGVAQDGQSDYVTAETATVQISGRVVSTPSLQLSQITVPTEVEFGTPLSIFITAIDVDDHQIQNANGRSFVLVVEGAGKVKNYVSTSQQGSAKFQVEVPSADLKVGDYKVPSACLPDALVSPRSMQYRCGSHKSLASL